LVGVWVRRVSVSEDDDRPFEPLESEHASSEDVMLSDWVCAWLFQPVAPSRVRDPTRQRPLGLGQAQHGDVSRTHALPFELVQQRDKVLRGIVAYHPRHGSGVYFSQAVRVRRGHVDNTL